ncbi:hypothetical protein [Rhodococcoides yunnanense]|uniref:hypothetical protein n=1 Tax=Rhodococcoides yunnanense TaxID=278209 RepID=UPI00352FFF9A
MGSGDGQWATTKAGPGHEYPGRTLWHAPVSVDPSRRGRVNHFHHPNEYIYSAQSGAGSVQVPKDRAAQDITAQGRQTQGGQARDGGFWGGTGFWSGTGPDSAGSDSAGWNGAGSDSVASDSAGSNSAGSDITASGRAGSGSAGSDNSDGPGTCGSEPGIPPPA